MPGQDWGKPFPISIKGKKQMKSMILNMIDQLNLFSFFNRYTTNTATVFMMHNILPDNEENNESFTTKKLSFFLDYLKKHRYTVISLAEYISALREHKKTYKTVVFTVDDGFRDFYLNAFPVFRDFGYPATVFLTSDFIEGKLFLWWNKVEFIVANTLCKEIDLSFMGFNTFLLDGEDKKSKATKLIVEHLKKLPNDTKLSIIQQLVDSLKVEIPDQPNGKYAPLTWDEIIEMSKYQIDFYPHTKTHPIMTRISYEQKLNELSESKILLEKKLSQNLLEKKLSQNLDFFCYPNGGVDDFDGETITALKDTGYTAAVTGMAGFDNTKDETDLFRIHRFGIPAKHVLFKQYICGLECFKNRYFS